MPRRCPPQNCLLRPTYSVLGRLTPGTNVRSHDDDIADRQGPLACYDRLTGPAEYVELSGVDHSMIHGPRRQEVFELVDDFQDRAA
jgi:hypothetical protein